MGGWVGVFVWMLVCVNYFIVDVSYIYLYNNVNYDKICMLKSAKCLSFKSYKDLFNVNACLGVL